MRQIESEAVVAIPVTEGDANRPSPSTGTKENARTHCSQSRKSRCFVASIVLVAVAVVVGSILGVFAGNRGDAPTKNVSTWIQVGQSLEGEAASDRFGFSVALAANGSIVAGGGPLNFHMI